MAFLTYGLRAATPDRRESIRSAVFGSDPRMQAAMQAVGQSYEVQVAAAEGGAVTQSPLSTGGLPAWAKWALGGVVAVIGIGVVATVIRRRKS